MNQRSTAVAVVLLAVVGAWIYFVEIRGAKKEEARKVGSPGTELEFAL